MPLMEKMGEIRDYKAGEEHWVSDTDGGMTQVCNECRRQTLGFQFDRRSKNLRLA